MKSLRTLVAAAAASAVLAAAHPARAVETKWPNDQNANTFRLYNLPAPNVGTAAIRLQDVAVGNGYLRSPGVNTLPLTAVSSIPLTDLYTTSVLNVAALEALAGSEYRDGARVFVQLLGRDFVFRTTNSSTVDHITVASVTGMPGARWVAELPGSRSFQEPTAYYVKNDTGSDEADCLTSGTPCKTMQELARRLRGREGANTITINVLADIPDTDVAGFDISPNSTGFSITIQGTQTVLATGTVSAAVAPAYTSNVLGEGAITGFDPGDYIGYLVRKGGTSGTTGTYATIVAEPSSGVARFSILQVNNATVTTGFVNGDTVEVIAGTKIPGVHVMGGVVALTMNDMTLTRASGTMSFQNRSGGGLSCSRCNIAPPGLLTVTGSTFSPVASAIRGGTGISLAAVSATRSAFVASAATTISVPAFTQSQFSDVIFYGGWRVSGTDFSKITLTGTANTGCGFYNLPALTSGVNVGLRGELSLNTFIFGAGNASDSVLFRMERDARYVGNLPEWPFLVETSSRGWTWGAEPMTAFQDNMPHAALQGSWMGGGARHNIYPIAVPVVTGILTPPAMSVFDSYSLTGVSQVVTFLSIARTSNGISRLTSGDEIEFSVAAGQGPITFVHSSGTPPPEATILLNYNGQNATLTAGQRIRYRYFAYGASGGSWSEVWRLPEPGDYYVGLTATRVGFGSSTNTLTGDSKFVMDTTTFAKPVLGLSTTNAFNPADPKPYGQVTIVREAAGLSHIAMQGVAASVSGALMSALKARGTSAVPAAAASGDLPLQFSMYGHDGTNHVTTLALVDQITATPSTGVVPQQFAVQVNDDAATLAPTEAQYAFKVDTRKNVYAGGSATVTGSTNGFFYPPAMAAIPTGTPANAFGSTLAQNRVPTVIDTADNRLYAYIGGVWRYSEFNNGTPTLAAGQVGYGSASSTLTGNAQFLFSDSFGSAGVTPVLTLGDGSTTVNAQLVFNQAAAATNTQTIRFRRAGTTYGLIGSNIQNAGGIDGALMNIRATAQTAGDNSAVRIDSSGSIYGALAVFTATGDVAMGGSTDVGGQLATNATNGFVFLPRMAGAPSGVPARANTSSLFGANQRDATVIDTTNKRLYWYDVGATAWRYAEFNNGVTSSVSLAATQIGFGNASNQLSGVNTFWRDATNGTIVNGLSTNPQGVNAIAHFARNLASDTELLLSNANTGTSASASFTTIVGSDTGISSPVTFWGTAGPNTTAFGSLITAGSAYLWHQPSTAGAPVVIYNASNNSGADVVLATGTTPTARLRVMNAGQVRIPNLNAGGMAKTDTNGELSLFQAGTNRIPFGSGVNSALTDVANLQRSGQTFGLGSVEEVQNYNASTNATTLTGFRTGTDASFTNSFTHVMTGTNWATGAGLVANMGLLELSSSTRPLAISNYGGGDVSLTTGTSRTPRLTVLAAGNVTVPNNDLMFTRSATQSIEKQGTGTFFIGTLGAQDLGLYSNNTTRLMVTSGGEGSWQVGATEAWYNAAPANYERVRAFWSSNVWTLKTESSSAPTRDMKIDATNAALHMTAQNMYLDHLSTDGVVVTEAGQGHLGVLANPVAASYKFSLYTTGFSGQGVKHDFQDIFTLADTGTHSWGTDFLTQSSPGGSVGANLAAVANTSQTPMYWTAASNWGHCLMRVEIPYFVASGSGSATLKVALWRASPMATSGSYVARATTTFNVGAGASSAADQATCSAGFAAGEQFFVAVYRTDVNNLMQISPIDVRVTVELYK